ncbi:type II secretion system F family protein [Nocardioides bruguierae]|uniref:Type II secretion system F family protein n=1 Tax=Nocardioides bruguierae TaxID=2945102 RepID=A0A9X2IFJ6_9ACTN|nr:type II secretion system F family protein [Nocardioides bruguierae]MCM0620514.1 type II secretion system F family protein [Nocardioides bruguierae]
MTDSLLVPLLAPLVVLDPAVVGGLLGGTAAAGVILAVGRVRALRRPQLSVRVLPYVRDLPQVGRAPLPGVAPASRTSALVGVFGPPVRSAAALVERVLGGSASVRRRLDRAGLEQSVHDFRVEQVLWGLAAFTVAAGVGLVRTLADPGSVLGAVALCAVALALGVLGRDWWLGQQVTKRERLVLAELPTLAELLSLAVAAGESPVGALSRVVARSRGAFSEDLAVVLGEIRTGAPVAQAFDRLAARTGLPAVARFAQGIATAVERGTPLADVLHAQAADVRESGRRTLIESAARREVLMMVPVVFLVLPVTVLFAFYPGLIGLSLSVT